MNENESIEFKENYTEKIYYVGIKNSNLSKWFNFNNIKRQRNQLRFLYIFGSLSVCPAHSFRKAIL